MAIPVLKLLRIAALLGVAYLAWTGFARDWIMGGVGAHDDIIVYVSDSCGRTCRPMIAAIKKRNDFFYVLNVDEDSEVAAELDRKLQASGFTRKIYEMPVVDAYGTILPDNPSIQKVMEALDRPRP